MASEWLETTLGEVVRLQRGHDLPEPQRQPGEVPVMGSFGITGWHNTSIEPGPGVTVGRSGASIGVVSYIDRPYWPLNTCLYVTDFLGNDPLFCYYWLKEQDLAAFNSGSAQPSLNRNYVYLKQVVFPNSVEEQRSISGVLRALDEKIELNRKMNETLEAMARALFKSWFVDFDPVRAKAEGRDTGLPAQIAALFPDSFEDSELGEIPKGWKLGTLGEFARLNPESWSKMTRPSVIEYVDLTNTKWGRIEATTTFESKAAPSRAQRVLRPGDTIVGTVRPGNGSYAFISVNGLTGSTGFAALRPKSAEISEFLYLAATARENVDALAHLADGGAYPAVRPEVVLSIQTVVPQPRTIAMFSHEVMPILSRIDASEHENRVLASMRDLLLPKLISGEILLGAYDSTANLVEGIANELCTKS
jgi:type I restriction enzyme S subunit